MSLLQEMETHGLADCEFNRRLISITKEQLSALEMLSTIGDYYLDDMEQSQPQYEDDRETVTQAQDVIQQIQQQFMGINNA